MVEVIAITLGPMTISCHPLSSHDCSASLASMSLMGTQIIDANEMFWGYGTRDLGSPWKNQHPLYTDASTGINSMHQQDC